MLEIRHVGNAQSGVREGYQGCAIRDGKPGRFDEKPLDLLALASDPRLQDFLRQRNRAPVHGGNLFSVYLDYEIVDPQTVSGCQEMFHG